MLLPRPRSLLHALSRRSLSYPSYSPKASVRIVEVGPRDGLQNEKKVLPTEMKVELIRRLVVEGGLRDVESGSFVSPKWVPQLATSAEIMTSPILASLRETYPTLSLPVLVPNLKGLNGLLGLSPPVPSSLDPTKMVATSLTNEIAIFVSASESFSRANLNCSIRESLDRLIPVVGIALSLGFRVRGYVSVVIGCPFEGRVEGEKVREVAKELVEMGCYEVSLGDTIGVGTPGAWRGLVESVGKSVGVEMMAAHCHDTYGTGVASVLAAVELGVTVIDSSISGLGGCPYSPGATGNVATEDIVYALESSGHSTSLLPLPASGAKWDDLLEGGERGRQFEKLAEIGEWVSGEVGRPNGSRAGRAALAGRERRRKLMASGP